MKADPLAQPCPACDADPGVRCWHIYPSGRRSGYHRAGFHAERHERARAHGEAVRADARRASWLALVAVRLHHPPRCRSEFVAFVPPHRWHDADEPRPAHPYYPGNGGSRSAKNAARRRAVIASGRGSSWGAGKRGVGPLPRTVVREAGVVVAIDCGRRVAPAPGCP